MCSRTGQVIEDNMAHMHCMLNTTRICNIYCFSTGTIISRNASLLRYKHIACLSSFGLRVSELYHNWLMFSALESGQPRRYGEQAKVVSSGVLFLGVKWTWGEGRNSLSSGGQVTNGLCYVCTHLNGFMLWTRKALHFHLYVISVQGIFLILEQKISYGDYTRVFFFA